MIYISRNSCKFYKNASLLLTWSVGKWLMENEKNTWASGYKFEFFAHVCGLAQFFGLGNRPIISVLDGFQNVTLILCFNPSCSPGNTTVCPLFPAGLKPWCPLSSRQSRASPNRTSYIFQESVSFTGFSVRGSVHNFFWCLYFCRFKFSTLKHVAFYWEKITVIYEETKTLYPSPVFSGKGE